MEMGHFFTEIMIICGIPGVVGQFFEASKLDTVGWVRRNFRPVQIRAICLTDKGLPLG